MTRIRLTRARGFALAIALLTTTAIPAAAQSGGPAADRLSEQVRILATNPRDLEALISAGQLSAKLGDTAAALAFLARAEAIDPNDPRTFAGRGTALVQMEKPGEALRMFNEAEKRGLAPSAYAADRGFAYDLLGAPELAQRDYRVALQTSNDDDTVRRLALSLGISGRGDEAMTLLDPLLRRSDRPAWRARAFILAMTGDVPGAEKIAASMMPGTMGASLTPFFRKLPTLGAADRAFAVHFGELAPTAARLADARTAPPLPAYTPSRPVVVAAAPPPPTTTAAVVPVQKNDRRSRRQREEDERKALAAARVTPAPAPVVVAAATPPALEPPRYQPPMVQSVPTASQGSFGSGAVQTVARPPVQLATRDAVRTPQSVLPAESDTRVRPDSAQTQPAPRAVEPRPLPLPPEPTPQPAPQPAAVLPPAPEPRAVEPRVVEAPRPTPRPAPVRTAPRKPDRSLAAIVENLDVPEDEKKVEVIPPTKGKPVKAETARAEASKTEPAKPTKAELAKLSKAELAKLSKAEQAKLKAEADAEDEKPTKGKKNARDDKKDKKPDPAKAEPARIWVQVAGGANEKALPTAWAKLVKDTPSLKGRSAYVTPLRATNRLLTGPFKSDDEAQAYVKKLRGEGLQAFQFTSDAGQKINKLGAGGAAADDNADEDTADKKATTKKKGSSRSDDKPAAKKPAAKKGGKKR